MVEEGVFRLFEMCIINAMCIYFEKYPDIGEKKNSHKIFLLTLVQEMVQPYLAKRTDEGIGTRGRQRSVATPPHSRRQIYDNVG